MHRRADVRGGVAQTALILSGIGVIYGVHQLLH
jgi:hypothetical protein